MSTLVARAVTYGRMVKLSHSVFALPFALASAVMASGGLPEPGKLLWIVVAMVGARSAAMGFNRLVDARIDARNPRTASREIPRGALTAAQVTAFIVLSAVALVGAAAMLNPLCMVLSPVALLIVFGYSYTKRFTVLSHVVLGLGLAIAPVGAWLAIRGRFELPPVVVGFAVLCWVAGFDIIYSCQDLEFDRREGLHSVPARVGVRRALLASRVLHVAAVGFLAALPAVTPLHPLYLGGVALVAALLLYEHSLVKASDLSRVDAAFFTVNGWISVAYLLAVVAGVLLPARPTL